MGKGARVACIFTPMALSITSLVLLTLIHLGGWSRTSPTLNSLYFFEADFSNYTMQPTNVSALSQALDHGRLTRTIADIYQIHLWDYCSGTVNKAGVGGNAREGDVITYCSPHQTGFWFNPVTIWGLNNTPTYASAAGDNPLSNLEKNATNLENKLLGDAGKKALDAYHTASHWMFALYAASFWFLGATVLFGFLAIFSRWGSFLTWIVSSLATILSLAASGLSTALFSTLVVALKGTLHGHDITLSLSVHTLSITWLSTACSMLATSFWLFSACCCSGKSNPHHHSNRAAPAAEWGMNTGSGAGYGGYGFGNMWGNGRGKRGGFEADERGRGLRVEKTGGYERVSSPFIGEDQVPLRAVSPAPPTGHARSASADGRYTAGYGGGDLGHGQAYEPFRHRE